MKKTINPFHMYVLEQEGYLDTRESKIQRVIKAVRAYPAATMPESAFRRTLTQNGIDPSSLTQRELRRIKNAI